MNTCKINGVEIPLTHQEEVVIDQSTDIAIAVDIQGAFLLGGGLPVPDGESIVGPAAKLLKKFERRAATIDVHIPGSVSLCSSYRNVAPNTLLTEELIADWTEENLAPHALFDVVNLKNLLSSGKTQVAWNDHALIGTPQTNLAMRFRQIRFDVKLYKGAVRFPDSYSGFCDNAGKPTGLAKALYRMGVKRVFIFGLAFDFCVGATALGAVDYETYVVVDLTRAINIPNFIEGRTSAEEMTRKLRATTVRLISSQQLAFPKGGK
ncbi:MAG: hypothetical protein WC551_06190 [Patescibacteria group bacterium]